MKTEEFATHVAWNALEDLHGHLEGDLSPDSDEDRYNIQRVHAAAELLDSIRGYDAVLIEPQVLNDVHKYLAQINNSLVTYLKDPDAQRQYLNNASTQVTNLIAILRSFAPFAVADEAQRAAKAASTRYRNSLDAEAQKMKMQVYELQEELAEVQAQRDAAKVAADTQLEDLSTGITNRGIEIDALAAKLEAQIDQQRVAFEEEAAARGKAFATSGNEREQAEEDRVKAVEEQVARQQEKQHADANEVLKQMAAYELQAAALIDTTSRHAITGDYKTWASHQARAAFSWTVAAVVLGLATISALIYAVGSAAGDSLQFTLYKTSISAVGLIIAGYAARQAGEHRREERAAKRMALDLAAMEPFLEQLEDASALREEIARRVFVPERGRDGDTEVRTRKGALNIRELGELLSVFRGGSPSV